MPIVGLCISRSVQLLPEPFFGMFVRAAMPVTP